MGAASLPARAAASTFAHVNAAPVGVACTTCNPELQAQIFDDRFLVRLLTIPLPLVLGGVLIAVAVGRFVAARERASGGDRSVALVAEAGAFLGLGLGGFLDGILLHQVLQVHQMISNHLPPDTLLAKNVNMFWDGMFHIGAWLLTALGVAALWRLVGRAEVQPSGAVLLGGAILGWGAFNTLDGLWNHYLLRYHNVVEWAADPAAWNAGFQLFGLVQVLLGWAVIRRATDATQMPRAA